MTPEFHPAAQEELAAAVKIGDARAAGLGLAVWVWDPTWPELVHPHAGAMDTPLPVPPDNVHCLVASKAPWVKVEGGADDPRFEHYPNMSLAQWHQSKGLTSPEGRSS